MTDEPQGQVIVRDDKGRFVLGHSGHPGGMPAGTLSLVGILKKRLIEHPNEAEAIINSLIAMGKTRELGAIKEILDRIDGKVVETHKIEGELPIKIVFVPAEQLKGGQYAIQGSGEAEALPEGLGSTQEGTQGSTEE